MGMRTDKSLDLFWESQSGLVRAFLDVQANYGRLAEEVAYILERSVRSAKIEYATISRRTKTLDSFCEKAIRKGYKKPLQEMTDIAGVRIVFLYLRDRPAIESLVEENFDIVEKVEKIDRNDPERFGYGALHYLLRLTEKSSGARYDEIRDLVCEVQVRTILQDAWAIVAHHLSYKQESDVPGKLRRKLTALCGLFETADDQFDRLREERISYTEETQKQLAGQGSDFRSQEVNLDNLIAYLNWRFPDRDRTDQESAADLLSELNEHGYTRLAQIDDAISSAYEAVKAYETKYPPSDRQMEPTVFAPVGVIRTALELTDDAYLDSKEARMLGGQSKTREFRPLVKK